ncbi:hypothetical protein [Arenimonas sp. MALMAid1274]|uniref:hypothetical protein n=1 Tax=Arenimonas sp. MALMAid1274 TaxID=3411630 RepID=UPI003B9FAE9C
MTIFSRLLPLMAVVGCASSTVIELSPTELLRVSCSSMDGGKTCFGYGELYADGRSDACGRVPNGPEFALQMTYEISGNTLCETVVKTSHSAVMPIGQKLCGIYTERRDNALVYRFTDDPTDKVRISYDAVRSDKWCQHLIDAL